MLVAALAATVPATAVGVDVQTVLSPTASGRPPVRVVLPAPIAVNGAGSPTTPAAGTPSASTPSAGGAASSGTASGTGSAGSGSSPTSSAPHHPATTAAALGIRPVSYWQGRFDHSDAGTFRTATALTTSSDSSDYYDASYYVDAYTSMWEATGQTRYLTGRSAGHQRSPAPDGVLGQPVPRQPPGWVSHRSTSTARRPLFESYMAVRGPVDPRDADTGGSATIGHGSRVHREEHLRQVDGPREHEHRSRTHMAAHWA